MTAIQGHDNFFLIMVNYVAVAQPNYVDSGKSCFAI